MILVKGECHEAWGNKKFCNVNFAVWLFIMLAAAKTLQSNSSQAFFLAILTLSFCPCIHI